MPRERWGTRLGIILAVAGSAVGLGNFLRFPVQVAQNGGGAFMVPYLVALFLVGIPLCWVEWTMGRAAGGRGHGSGPGILNVFWESRGARYFGALGIFIPLMIYFYYVYIESWCLAYSWFAISGSMKEAAEANEMGGFLSAFQGLKQNRWFAGISPAYAFFVITFCVNFFFIYRGLAKGIETICKIAMPILVIMGVIIVFRVLTLGAPDLSMPEWNISEGLGFLWNPDFSALLDSRIWLAAAGQIFFTTSVGLGLIITYASYLRESDDVALSGLTSISINEFVEVIIGASIAIPAAFVFFGPVGIGEIAGGGAFNLGFVTMPMVFDKMPFTALLGFMWFFLLFLAGITSSISMLQPGIAFLEDEFRLSRKQSVTILGVFSFLAAQPAIFFIDKGVLDMMDFWAGTFAIVVFATGEVIIFGWVYGIEKGFKQLHQGADIKVPSFFKFVIKYVTPGYLLIILGSWLWRDAWGRIPKPGDENFYYTGGALLCMALFLVGLVALVEIAWRKKESRTDDDDMLDLVRRLGESK
ncbi:Sodium-dependent transporter, SNF family [hydrothermal vent metagenome]|uniref:Sodium-dependent transporter, SNF family n=1 Tax=hydrothermal vent metagenome TaxID=652676 RepID=A0A3B1CNF3_9ZZZZ